MTNHTVHIYSSSEYEEIWKLSAHRVLQPEIEPVTSRPTDDQKIAQSMFAENWPDNVYLKDPELPRLMS